MKSITLLFWAVLDSTSASPFQVAASKDTYGPDGPWQAVRVGLGTPPQTINLYPVGSPQSLIFSKEICMQYADVTCASGGVFDASASNSLHNMSSSPYTPNGSFDGIALSFLDSLELPAAPDGDRQNIQVPNLDMTLFYSFSLNNITYPDGSVYPKQLGHLGLSQFTSRSWGADQGISPEINSSLIPGSLKNSALIDSTSYGLHFGSGALQLPISLWLGGYDSERIIGSVFSGGIKDNEFHIDLLDIGIGIDAGVSPFPFNSKQGILPSTYALNVKIVTERPYLYLPEGVCQSIVQDLPVTFQPKYGLYFWNTRDPRYNRIVTSPSYLSFTFRAPNLSQGNLTVNVPFQLLNLTLSSPLIPTPTAYFPCWPMNSSAAYTLGRTFLQAAFFGVNWSKKPYPEWYLAQAPGPNIPSSPTEISFGDNISSGTGDWSETWKNNWTPLSDTSQPSTTVSADPITATTSFTNTTNTTTTSLLASTFSPFSTARSQAASSSEGLSGGIKAGTAIGAAAFFGLIVLATSYFTCYRRSMGQKSSMRPEISWPLPMTPSQESELSPDQIEEMVLGALFEIPDREPTEVADHPGLSHQLPPNEVYEAPPRCSTR